MLDVCMCVGSSGRLGWCAPTAAMAASRAPTAAAFFASRSHARDLEYASAPFFRRSPRRRIWPAVMFGLVTAPADVGTPGSGASIVAYSARVRRLPFSPSSAAPCARQRLCRAGGNLIECGSFDGRLRPAVTQPLTADGRRSARPSRRWRLVSANALYRWKKITHACGYVVSRCPFILSFIALVSSRPLALPSAHSKRP